MVCVNLLRFWIRDKFIFSLAQKVFKAREMLWKEFLQQFFMRGGHIAQ